MCTTSESTSCIWPVYLACVCAYARWPQGHMSPSVSVFPVSLCPPTPGPVVLGTRLVGFVGISVGSMNSSISICPLYRSIVNILVCLCA